MKNILVHLDGGDRSHVRLELAISLAKTHQARLGAIFGQLAAPHRVGVVATWPSDAYAQMATASRAGFTAAAADLPATCWHDANRGSAAAIAEVIGDIARCFDLTILGQGGDDSASPDIAAAILARSGRPALVIPFAGAFPTIGRAPLLVWDDSPSAARALSGAVALLDAQTTPTVLVLTGKSVDTGKSQAVLDYLHGHGITARVEHVAQGESSPADLILNRAADLGTDLVVAGWSAGPGEALLRHLTVPALLAG